MSINTPQPSNTTVVSINSVQDLRVLGEMLAQSRMFGSDTNPAQGLVIVGMCAQEGISWAKWSQTYNLIHGQVSKRTDAMLADYQRMGGRHKVIRRDPDGAAIEFDFDGTTYRSECTWESIKGESFVLSPKTGQLKDKYATPRSRMQMLWARAVSDGLRVVCPMCCAGVYTPEEVSDFVDNPVPRPAYQPEPEPQDVVPEPVPEPEPAPADGATPDYTICPVPGKMFGKPWTDFTDAALAAALSYPETIVPALTASYRDAINQELAARAKRDIAAAQKETPNA